MWLEMGEGDYNIKDILKDEGENDPLGVNDQIRLSLAKGSIKISNKNKKKDDAFETSKSLRPLRSPKSHTTLEA